MNSKKTKGALFSSVIALVLCFTMLLGTTFAWFTDEVTSANNIITAGNLDVEVTNDEGDIEEQEALFDHVTLWEPGVVAYENLTVANVGTLALQYKMNIVFAEQNTVVDNGLGLADVLKVAVLNEKVGETDRDALTSSITNWALLSDLDEVGKLYPEGSTVGDSSEDFAIVIWWEPSDEDNKWNVNNGRETSDGEPLHITLGLNLTAIQLSYEEDSYGDDYDSNTMEPDADVLPYPETTVSYTKGIGGQVYTTTLDVAYQFLPSETKEEALAGGYGLWNADYIVSIDKDVAAGEAGLAGYYKLFCGPAGDGSLNINNGNWVALTDAAVPANTPIRLVKPILGQPVNYSEICEFGNDGIGFLCGAWAEDTLAGATLTVELRLYETYTEAEALEKFGVKSTNYEKADYETDVSDENPYYITVGTYTYTFPVTPVEAGDQTEMENAITNAASDVVAVELADGEYTLPSVSSKDVTFSGTEDTVITVTTPAYHGSNVVFEGVTVKGSGYATGVQHVNTATYNNATIEGEMCLYGEKVVFNDCTFELTSGQYIWTYGAKEVEFNNCTFNTAGKAILIYNEGAGASKVTVTSCTFNATAGATAGAIVGQNCAAIEIDNFQTSGTGAAHVLVTEDNTVDNNFSGEWRIKNYVAGNNITVNGTAYTQIALDGKLMAKNSDNTVAFVD